MAQSSVTTFLFIVVLTLTLLVTAVQLSFSSGYQLSILGFSQIVYFLVERAIIIQRVLEDKVDLHFCQYFSQVLPLVEKQKDPVVNKRICNSPSLQCSSYPEYLRFIWSSWHNLQSCKPGSNCTCKWVRIDFNLHSVLDGWSFTAACTKTQKHFSSLLLCCLILPQPSGILIRQTNFQMLNWVCCLFLCFVCLPLSLHT